MFEFEWHPGKGASNLRKHGVSFELAATVFGDPLVISIPDEEHSECEERWVTTGEGRNGRLIVVCHTFHRYEDAWTVRIISARPATRTERQAYEVGG